MYTSFFGLSRAPFSIAPDPGFLFMSPQHREALAHLLYGLRTGGMVVLSGEIGTGKTTVCRHFLAQLPANCQVAYVFNPKLSVIELLQTVCDEFHLPRPSAAGGLLTVKDLVDPLNAFLLQTHAAGKTSLLVIDEAQSLSMEVLEQLRLLTNLETNERKLLNIVLIGQPELRQMLARPKLEQLAQRVTEQFHLGALDAAQTEHYISHRLGVAGGQGTLPFERAALRHIHRLSGGVPRRINLLCDRALLGAFVQERHRVDRRIVAQAGRETLAFAPGRAPRRRLAWGLLALGLATLAGGGAGAYFQQKAQPQAQWLPPLQAPSAASATAWRAPVTRPATPAPLAAPAEGLALHLSPALNGAGKPP